MKPATLLALGIGLQACAPYDYAEQPNEEEAASMEMGIDHYNLVTPLAADLAKKSKVPLVDKYGNYDESGNKQVAAGLIEKNELLNWFYINDRILLYDAADYRGTSEDPPGGMYRTSLGQEHKNDWIYIDREHIGSILIYAHEIAHLFFAKLYHGHSKEVYTHLADDDNQEALSQSGDLLQYSIDQQDPAHQDGQFISETWSFFININPSFKMDDIIWDVLEEVDRDELTPQQGYDRLYKELQKNRANFYQQSIHDAMYDDDGNYSENYGLWPLELEENEILEVVLECPEMQEWYQRLTDYMIEEFYLIEFSDGQIETWEERNIQEAREKSVTDMDGYRSINKKRLK